MIKTPQSSHAKKLAGNYAATLGRMLKRLHRIIDRQMELACDLEVAYSLALHQAGKNPVVDGREMIRQARKHIGQRV